MKKIIKSKYLIGLFFALFFLYGIIAFNDYGISCDEPIESKTSSINFEYMVSNVVNLFAPGTFEVPDLENYSDNMYGMAIRVPIEVLSVIFHLQGRDYYLAYHFYVFLLFFTALIMLYRLLIKLKITPVIAMIGVIMLVFSPRILAESFYNIKDSVFLSLFIMNLFWGFKLMDKSSIKNGIIFCIISAFTINTRFLGGVVFISIVLLILLRTWNSSRKKAIVQMLLLCFFAFLCYVLMTPYTWSNPIIKSIDIVRKFSSYPWIGSVLFNGKLIASDSLPWYYLIEWILISTPIVYSVFCVIGLFLTCREVLINRKKIIHNSELLFKGFLVFLLIFVLMADAFLQPIKYDEWRHFRFLYSIIIIMATLAIDKLMSSGPKLKIVTAVLLLMGILNTGVWMFHNHPYEYAYFNPLMRSNVEENFEKDYWGLSIYDAVQEVLALEATNDNISIDFVPQVTMGFLLEEDRARINTSDTHAAEYLIGIYHAEKGSEFNDRYEEAGYTMISSIKVDGFKICSTWKKNNVTE